ncbi:hypothetical protein BGC30_13325 [Novacetimonas hansenii]|nr:hypothetical protein BGC30_13325 [Novacetimonas hansenii]
MGSFLEYFFHHALTLCRPATGTHWNNYQFFNFYHDTGRDKYPNLKVTGFPVKRKRNRNYTSDFIEYLAMGNIEMGDFDFTRIGYDINCNIRRFRWTNPAHIYSSDVVSRFQRDIRTKA